MDQFEKESTPAALNFFVPGRNCWRVERARRVRFLIGWDEYFRAVRRALANAQRSIFVIGWDIDHRTRLAAREADDGLPANFGDFLNCVVERRRDLRASLLTWDFAMLFALERECLPLYKIDWNTHRRLAFRLDGAHPRGASHHQKIVVVDDAVAFVGGFDLTRCRWDTPAHGRNAPEHRDSDGKPYPPIHGVQAMVDGDAAHALGELARRRWLRAGGKPARVTEERIESDPWPSGCAPDIEDADIAIARTEPAWKGHAAVHEILNLHLDMIAAARHSIYAENRYVTSSAIGHALADRLLEESGLEAVLVVPRSERGWLSQRSVDVLQARVHRRLREADPEAARYRMYCPRLPELPDETLDVQSTLLMADDAFLTLGSANLSNRSMTFDSECNLAIASGRNERASRAIAALRNRLLGEHLGTEPARMETEFARQSSLLRAIEALCDSGRTLSPIEPLVTADSDRSIPREASEDPERPMDPQKLLAEFVPGESKRPPARHIARIAAFVVVLGGLAAAWRWTPLHEWLNVDRLVQMAAGFDRAPYAPLAVIVAYVAAGFVVMPITVLIAATGIVFGPFMGAVYALVGAVVSAGVMYAIGRRLGRETVRRVAGARLNRLSRQLARRGVLAIALLRMLPLAPFTVVNIVAGASYIGVRDFLLGTVIGLTPGILATVVFVDRIVEAVRNPSAITFISLAAVIVVVAALAVVARRRFGGSQHGAS